MAKPANPSSGRAAALWPTLRAVLIAYFIVFNLIAAVPSTGGNAPEKLERPAARAELARWVQLFQSLGVDTDGERLAAAYFSFAGAVEEARAVALRPIRWWFELTQTGQSWRLFGTPRERPSALQISAWRGAEEQVLYRSQAPQHRWNATLLEYRRVRAAYTPVRGGPVPTYAAFARRVAERAFQELPDADRVHVALIESHTTLPGAPPDPVLTPLHEHDIRRPAP